jgi:outer membrane lipoprotein carrier protein
MKISFIRFLYSIVLLTLITSVHAASGSADLSSLLDSVQSMKANFIQTVYDNRGKAIQKSYGRMAMQRPGKFRWEVTRPIPQLIIANGTKLWIYDPDLQQLTIRSLQKAAGETPALLLSHVDTTLDKDFTVKAIQKNMPGWSWYALTPKKPDSMFEAIQMGFMNKQIHELRLTDNLGHTTVIQYQNIQTNINLSASLFTFKPTAKIDVIDETRKK